MVRVRRPVVWLVVLLVVVVATWPQAVRLNTGVSDFGDPLLNAWALAWVGHAVVAQPAHLFDANVFYPERFTLAYSEALLAPGLLLAPLGWLGADPILVQNVLLLLAYLLSGIVMFELVRSVTGHDGAALVAAVVFALYPYRIEEYPKVQLQLLIGWPLALLAVHRLLDRASWRAAIGLAAAIALQAYSCVYYGVMGAFVVAVIVALLVAMAPADRRRPAILAIGAGTLIAGLIVAPLAIEYRAASLIVGERHADDLAAGSAVANDYLRAHPENAAYGDDGHPGQGERRLFPGYAAPALAIAAFVPPVGAATIAYAAGGLVAADLSFGVNTPGYGWLFDHLSPLRALRVPARFAMFVGLALAVLAGLGVARVCRSLSRAQQAALVAVAIAVVTWESRMRPQVLESLADPAPAVYSWLAAQPHAVVCEYPVGPLEGRLGPQDATYMVLFDPPLAAARQRLQRICAGVVWRTARRAQSVSGRSRDCVPTRPWRGVPARPQRLLHSREFRRGRRRAPGQERSPVGGIIPMARGREDRGLSTEIIRDCSSWRSGKTIPDCLPTSAWPESSQA